MLRFLIRDYVNKLTLNDIMDYSIKYNVDINIKEAEIILHYIKKHWKILLEGDAEEIFAEVKTKISADSYNKICDYYYKFKNKIDH